MDEQDLKEFSTNDLLYIITEFTFQSGMIEGMLKSSQTILEQAQEKFGNYQDDDAYMLRDISNTMMQTATQKRRELDNSDLALKRDSAYSILEERNKNE